MSSPAPFRYVCCSCGATVESPARLPAEYPFCSARCRMVDLGRWLREQYSVERELQPEDLGDPSNEPPAAHS